MADIVRFQLRRDSAAAWASANPVLADGEPGIERDTRRQKIGDGVTAWNSLPYSDVSEELVAQTLSAASETADNAASAAVARTAAETARSGAESAAARAEAIPATNDGIVGELITDPASQTRGVLNATTLALIEEALPTVPHPVTIPPELGWDGTYSFNISVTEIPGTSRAYGTLDKTPEQIFDAASTARTAPANTYYVSPTGVNTNDGLTSGTSLRSIWKAIELANATGQPAKIFVTGAKYIRSHNIWSTGATGYPTVDIALIATGGRVVTGSFDDAGTPTVDATYTNTYSWAVANCNKVVDMANLNRYGNFTELVKVPTAAECNVIPNSWALVAGILYVNRADRQPVTTATTRIYRPSSNGLALRKAVNFYMGGETGNDGWDIEGGNNIGVFDITVNPANNPYTGKFVCVVKNSTFRYGGGVTDTITRAVSVEGWNGFIGFFNCRGDAGQTDGFNFHNVYNAPSMNILMMNCTGFDNGRYPQPSCNAVTAHENVVGIDVAGHYKDSHGGTLRNIGTSKWLTVAPWFDGDHGDVPHGGSVPPTAVRIDDSAELWAEGAKITAPAGGYGYVTGSPTAKIHRKNPWPTPSPDSGNGTFDTYA